MGSGDARRHVPALPPVGGNAAGAAYCHHYLVTENCWSPKKPLALSWRVCEDDGVMRSDASLRSGRSRLTQLVRSPLTAHRSPNRALADRSAPVLSATPPIRVAPSRHAWVSDGRRIRPQRVRASHGRPGRSPLPPVHTSMRSDVTGQRRGTSVPDRGGAK